MAFEPSTRELRRLYRNLALNDVHNVVVMPYGLASKQMTAVLAISGDANSGMNSTRPIDHAIGQERCSFVRLDDVVPEAMLDHVRLVKIDVEGAELDVLLGMGRFMPRLSRSTFVVEITQTYLAQLGASAKEVYEFFDRHGFRPDGEPNRLPQYDEVFHPARC